MDSSVSAEQIVKLLREKHSGDIFVPECKTGATHTGDGMRLDAWAMRKTWNPPTTIGYEIKVSRSDFLGDQKWPRYLDCCHQFYFVVPHSLIQRQELPESCGLLWVSKTGTRLFTKVKAPRREIGWPAEVMAYLLMSRAQISASQFSRGRQKTRDERLRYWEAWLEDKQRARTIGHAVRGKIVEHARVVELKNEELERKISEYQRIEERIRELGFDPADTITRWQVESRINHLAGQIPPHLPRRLRNGAAELQRLAELTEQLVQGKLDG